MNMITEDYYEIPYEFEDTGAEEISGDDSQMSVSDAFITCRRKLHRPDIDFIAELAHTSAEMVAEELEGVVLFQDPEAFNNPAEWNIHEGWLFREQFLSGFLPEKLKAAKQMNRRTHGRFRKEIEALETVLSSTGSPEQLEITLGAPYIPVDIYAAFFKTLLRLNNEPTVTYNPLKNTFHFAITSKDDLRTAKSNPLYNTLKVSVVELINKTMRPVTIKVYDEKTDYYGKKIRILNKAETYRAQEMQRRLLKAFKDYVNASVYGRLARIKEEYAKLLKGFYNMPYDGSYLEFPDLNPEVKPFPYQKNAIAQTLESKYNVGYFQRVGAGKSHVITISAHELHRTGLSRRIMIVLPNQILQDFDKLHRLCYEHDKYLVVTPEMFTPGKRAAMLEKIRNGDHVCVYISYSSFSLIPMSKRYKIAQMAKRLNEIRAAAAAAENSSQRNSLERMAETQSKKLSEFALTYQDPPHLCYDDLGIDTLFVDEAHNFKNITITSCSDDIIGMRTKGSKAADDMLEKVHFTDRTIFSTGTPLTNSIADLYTLMMFLQPEQLKFRHIDSFDMWLKCFAQRESDYELDVSHSLRPVTRFSTFHNLTELMEMFSLVSNFYYEKEDEELPEAVYTNITLQKTREQEEYIKGLAERTELIRRHLVKRTEDNLLKITTDGRKCALDQRLVGMSYLYGDNKIKACAEQVYQIYRQNEGKAQVVFSDIGTPKDDFNVYDELRSELVLLGIPYSQIAFIHTANSERARLRMFEAVNSGELRVIIGSTDKLGVGVNIQENLVALHHLSIPWRPSDVEQREGRIIRRGNSCQKVHIFRYITEGTFDGYSWQLLENKQKFIASFLSGASSVSKTEDISGTVLTYGEIKALAIGNGLIKQRIETANKLEHLRISRHQRSRQLLELKQIMDTYPDKIKHQKQLEQNTRRDSDDYLKARGRVSREERLAFGEELIDALQEHAFSYDARIFDSYQGFAVELPADMPMDRPYVYLVGKSGERYYAAMDYEKPMGCAQRLDFILEHLGERAQEQNATLSQYRRQLKDARADYAKGNPYEEQMEALEEELERIDRELNESEAA